MKIAIISITENGRALSENVAKRLDEHDTVRFCFVRHTDENAVCFEKLETLLKEYMLFTKYEALVFVCACGIAVRSIAPHISSKQTDPAVIVIDDEGHFVISLLSGHIGRANALAGLIAEKISAQPVITTATDTGKKFSPDSFAKANDLLITDITAAKVIASAVLDGEKIGFLSEYKAVGIPDGIQTDTKLKYGIVVGNAESPFEVTLRLLPKNIVLGVGCKKGISAEIFEKNALELLNDADISRLCAAATIDIKANEAAIKSFCEKYGIPLYTYSAEELMRAEGDFTASDFVKSVTGTDNVCERSAVVHSGGRLIMRKKAANGVTVAAAEKDIVLDFKKRILD